jgi:CRP-like cAMP-binding protein
MTPPAPSPKTLIKRSPLFNDLSPRGQVLLAEAAFERRHTGGEMIVQKGERPTGLFFIVSGKVKEALQSADGREKILELLGPGQTCGEAAMLIDSPYPYFLVALTNCLLLHIDARTIHTLIDTERGFAARLARALSNRMYGLRCDLETYSLYSPLQRVTYFLLDLAHESRAEMPVVTLPATKAVIASRLGMTPEAMSRNLRDMADAGLIEVRANRIALIDKPRLQALLP